MPDISKSFVVLSSLAEDKGHLLLDDEFWFSNLVRYDTGVVLMSSESSCNRMNKFYPSYKNQFISFKDSTILKKINYRLFLLGRLFTCAPIKNKCIIFQGFDEIALLLYYWRSRNWNNTRILVLTNNISPERLERSRKMIQYLFKKLVEKSDVVFYHTDFEFNLIEGLIDDRSLLKKFRKIRYHLLGKNNSARKLQSSHPTISYFGPVMASKPLKNICQLIASDSEKRFKYRFFNINESDISYIRSNAGANFEMVEVYNHYLSNEEYMQAIGSSSYIFLPHNKMYEGKLSGIFSDAVSQGTPIISDHIEPIIEFFNNYGSMGFIFHYDNAQWISEFWRSVKSINIDIFRQNMNKCREDHEQDIIIRSFISDVKMKIA